VLARCHTARSSDELLALHNDAETDDEE